MRLDDPEDRTVACAEYVLGTLTGADRDAFLAALAKDAALQAEVGYWQDRLLGLAARVTPTPPSSQVWQRIQSALDDAPVASPAAASPAVEPVPARPPVTATVPGLPARRPAAPVPLLERLGFWRFVSGVSVAASLLLASLLWLRAPEIEIRYVAVLQSPERQEAGWIVHAAAQGPIRLVPLVPTGPVPSGNAWQFWTKPKDATAPTSLGLVPAGSAIEIARDRLPGLAAEQLFEITLEPATGSPTGRPTGPVLFIGRASAI